MTEIERIEYNKKLIERYPFLLPRNRFTDEVPEDYDYTFTELDAMEEGWKEAFGEMMCEEIREALLENDLLDRFRIDQLKEKYGSMRLYSHGGNQKVDDIINKYEILSMNICGYCGKPDVGTTKDGWIYPLCEECWSKNKYNEGYNYEDYVETENVEMPTEMKFTRFSKDGNEKVVIDISGTVNKIRENWEKNNDNKSE